MRGRRFLESVHIFRGDIACEAGDGNGLPALGRQILIRHARGVGFKLDFLFDGAGGGLEAVDMADVGGDLLLRRSDLRFQLLDAPAHLRRGFLRQLQAIAAQGVPLRGGRQQQHELNGGFASLQPEGFHILAKLIVFGPGHLVKRQVQPLCLQIEDAAGVQVAPAFHALKLGVQRGFFRDMPLSLRVQREHPACKSLRFRNRQRLLLCLFLLSDEEGRAFQQRNFFPQRGKLFSRTLADLNMDQPQLAKRFEGFGLFLPPDDEGNFFHRHNHNA